MSKLKYLQKFKYIITNLSIIMEEVEQLINEETNLKIQKKIYKENMKILEAMCKGENLNFNEIKKKYINIQSEIKEETKDVPHEKLLDIITVNDNTYYYENIPNGSVYNDKLEKVGSYNNGKINLS